MKGWPFEKAWWQSIWFFSRSCASFWHLDLNVHHMCPNTVAAAGHFCLDGPERQLGIFQVMSACLYSLLKLHRMDSVVCNQEC